MPINKFRIAFVLTKFPSQSEVPILNQIVGVVKQGHRVEIFADISEENVLHDDIAKYGLLDKVSYFKQRPIHNSKNKTLNKLSLILKTLPLIIRAFIKRPTITLRALNYRKYGSYAKSFWLFYNSYTFIFLSREYDILHAQFGPNGEKIALLKDIGLIKAKLLTSFRGYDINVIPKSDSIFKDYTYLKKWGDEFTVNTNFTKQKLIKEGFVKNNIHIIHSAIQFKNFNPTVKQNSDNSIKLISIGRLVDCKGIEFALKAIPLIQERLHKFEIIYRIIGDGVLKEELQTLCYSLNIESLVEFKGWQSQDNTIDAMNTDDILLHPAVIGFDGSEEAQGLVLQEAQAMQLPVISTNIGGIPEGLIDKETGFIIRPNNVEDIVDKTVEIVSRNLAVEMGKKGRQFVCENFSQDVLTNKLVKVYESMH